jgi:cell division protein FtsB
MRARRMNRGGGFKGVRRRRYTVVRVDSSILYQLLPMFGGAIAILFGGYSGFLLKRINEEKEQNKALKEENKALERENKTLTAMIVMASESADGMQELRKELARLLRGGPS